MNFTKMQSQLTLIASFQWALLNVLVLLSIKKDISTLSNIP